MKLRITIAALCSLALAAPVIASIPAPRFEDVPPGHKHAEAIRWASDPTEFSDGPPLFRGFHDGTFRPDRDLTENQLITVTKRLFNSQDAWTRAETAALLYHGFQVLYGDTDQPAVSTTTGGTTTIPNTPTRIEYRGTEYIGRSSFYLLLHSTHPIDVKIQASYKCSPMLYKRLSAGITKILIPCANVVGGTNDVFFEVTGAEDGTRHFTGAVRFPLRPTAAATTTTTPPATTTTTPPSTTTTAAAATTTTLFPVVIEPTRYTEGWFQRGPSAVIKHPHPFRLVDIRWE